MKGWQEVFLASSASSIIPEQEAMLSNLRTSYTVLLEKYFLHQNTQGKAHDLQKLLAKLLFTKQILPQIKNQGLLVKVPKSRQSTLILCHLTYTFSAEIYFQLFVSIITIPRPPILLISSSTRFPVPLLKQSDTRVLSSLLLYHQQHIYTVAKPLPTRARSTTAALTTLAKMQGGKRQLSSLMQTQRCTSMRAEIPRKQRFRSEYSPETLHQHSSIFTGILVFTSRFRLRIQIYIQEIAFQPQTTLHSYFI